MERFQIHITSQQRRALAKLAKSTGLPMADLIRRAIDRFVSDPKRIANEIPQ